MFGARGKKNNQKLSGFSNKIFDYSVFCERDLNSKYAIQILLSYEKRIILYVVYFHNEMTLLGK